MNNILQLKGQFNSQSNRAGFGGINIPINGKVTAQHIIDLKVQLEKYLEYWTKDTRIDGALISVYYNHVVAKSNRIKGLLCIGNADPNEYICGTRFSETNPVQHIFTYYIKLEALRESIKRLEKCAGIVTSKYGGTIMHDQIKALNDNSDHINSELPKTCFLKVISDAYYVEKFHIDMDTKNAEETSIITIYKTDKKTSELLESIGISTIDKRILDETTILLTPDEIKILCDRMPYLISMSVHDLAEIVIDDVVETDSDIMQIPPPAQEPTVGVIDTLFYKDVYFKDWVTYVNMIDKNIEISSSDYEHGTEVTSIIVDGPSINPELDDGCGRFKVKHFGVAKHGRFSSFTILRDIREIVATNRDIKVWNLSLGSAMEINSNFISPEAAELDKIQSEYDVIFIVAGTNRPNDKPKGMKIGAPADSLNSLVVNSVNFNKEPASYYRVGPVLSFFNKPDISYYGGDKGQYIKVCSPTGANYVRGTSFAAPWITRKVAYLIHNLGLSREVAKALIIDSAADWNRKDDVSHSIGYGVVPIKIDDIVKTKDDEIRFIMNGSADEYETYTYHIPVPAYNEKHPFFARATLCYFPKCLRSQGVDYTSTEMDIHFGRVKEEKVSSEKNGVKTERTRFKIVPLNGNRQSDLEYSYLPEENMRKMYRKWDNVKHINDKIKKNARPLKSYGTGDWGLSIVTKERLRERNGKGMPFGVVITLKEMNGKNRINDFIKLCMIRGWIVNQIDVVNRTDLYNKAEEEIEFE